MVMDWFDMTPDDTKTPEEESGFLASVGGWFGEQGAKILDGADQLGTAYISDFLSDDDTDAAQVKDTVTTNQQNENKFSLAGVPFFQQNAVSFIIAGVEVNKTAVYITGGLIAAIGVYKAVN